MFFLQIVASVSDLCMDTSVSDLHESLMDSAFYLFWDPDTLSDFRSGSDVQRRHSGRLLPQGPVYRGAVRFLLSRLQL